MTAILPRGRGVKIMYTDRALFCFAVFRRVFLYITYAAELKIMYTDRALFCFAVFRRVFLYITYAAELLWCWTNLQSI